MAAEHLTIGELSEIFGVPTWKVRRAVDSLHADIPRAGRYRLVPRHLLGKVAVALEAAGWPVPVTSGTMLEAAAQ